MELPLLGTLVDIDCGDINMNTAKRYQRRGLVIEHLEDRILCKVEWREAEFKEFDGKWHLMCYRRNKV